MPEFFQKDILEKLGQFNKKFSKKYYRIEYIQWEGDSRPNKKNPFGIPSGTKVTMIYKDIYGRKEQKLRFEGTVTNDMIPFDGISVIQHEGGFKQTLHYRRTIMTTDEQVKKSREGSTILSREFNDCRASITLEGVSCTLMVEKFSNARGKELSIEDISFGNCINEGNSPSSSVLILKEVLPSSLFCLHKDCNKMTVRLIRDLEVHGIVGIDFDLTNFQYSVERAGQQALKDKDVLLTNSNGRIVITLDTLHLASLEEGILTIPKINSKSDAKQWIELVNSFSKSNIAEFFPQQEDLLELQKQVAGQYGIVITPTDPLPEIKDQKTSSTQDPNIQKIVDELLHYIEINEKDKLGKFAYYKDILIKSGKKVLSQVLGRKYLKNLKRALSQIKILFADHLLEIEDDFVEQDEFCKEIDGNHNIEVDKLEFDNKGSAEIPVTDCDHVVTIGGKNIVLETKAYKLTKNPENRDKFLDQIRTQTARNTSSDVAIIPTFLACEQCDEKESTRKFLEDHFTVIDISESSGQQIQDELLKIAEIKKHDAEIKKHDTEVKPPMLWIDKAQINKLRRYEIIPTSQKDEFQVRRELRPNPDIAQAYQELEREIIESYPQHEHDRRLYGLYAEKNVTEYLFCKLAELDQEVSISPRVTVYKGQTISEALKQNRFTRLFTKLSSRAISSSFVREDIELPDGIQDLHRTLPPLSDAPSARGVLLDLSSKEYIAIEGIT